jgi:pyrimidine-nucleoside phosphorylase
VQGKDEARAELEHLLDSRRAWRKFTAWIAAQGGDVGAVESPDELPAARFVRDVSAPRAGYVAGVNAREVGLVSMLLGGGRAKKGDKVDHAVGVVLQTKVGDYVEKGEPLLTVHANDEGKMSGALQRLLGAYDWSDEPVEPPPLVHRIVR